MENQIGSLLHGQKCIVLLLWYKKMQSGLNLIKKHDP